ncbi:hypothetical protein [Ralstonia sp. ASV6]|uniref:hypothetical protein n=1 Tax=Ralstonia sp. ASV6 TaxID=2795124 RepID=UPI0018EC88E2|nr:hypothetical protein [Ralstonia sp. ASV6]
MRKIFLVSVLVPGMALAQMPPVNVLMAPAGAEASDAQLQLASGFVQCNPSVALSRTELSPLGVKFGPIGKRYAHPSVNTTAEMVLAPQAQQSQRTGDGKGYLSVVADYKLRSPLQLLTSPVQIIQVGEAAYYEETPATVSIALRFKQPAAEAVREFDKRFGGGVGARLGTQYAANGRWFVIEEDGHTLRCFRHPDVAEKP